MAKEKTEFEILANTLKAMNKQCTAKVKDNRAALSAIFISNEQQLAFATDGHKIAILDMYGHMEHKEIEELAFYADMQAIEFNNGFALVSAKKKETFVKNFGEGIFHRWKPSRRNNAEAQETAAPADNGAGRGSREAP